MWVSSAVKSFENSYDELFNCTQESEVCERKRFDLVVFLIVSLFQKSQKCIGTRARRFRVSRSRSYSGANAKRADVSDGLKPSRSQR